MNDSILEIDERLKKELEPLEKILWIGHPSPSIWSQRCIGIMILNIFWTSFMFYATLSVLDFKLPSLAPLDWRIVLALAPFTFFLLGILILTYPFFENMRARKTLYSITDRRVIILEHVWTRGSFAGETQVIKFGPADLVKYLKREDKKGYGDIIFKRLTHRDSEGSITVEEQGFIGIPHVSDVERTIKQIRIEA